MRDGPRNRLMPANKVQNNAPVNVTRGFARGYAKIIEINFAHLLFSRGICFRLELYSPGEKIVQRILR